ncbi:MAG: 3-dehydroquinate synthase [Halobacteriovoraceae bacterium]|nr:3-dehydroquinate synthase [Halobacteriovoraceae bacterium]|tara:strand:+ start:13744 stop:14697 length:954 start_codon:yes stop_codon:yes gene_type:complete
MLIEELKSNLDKFKYFIVDKRVVELYPQLSFLNEKVTYIVDGPESNKTMKGYEKAINFFLENKISRSDKIVAIGGGALSDLGGFVASSILRGIDWVVVPTTLLSIIDASIGGKTGINSDFGKNLIGAFHMPSESYVCLDFIKTLDPIELDSGKGELSKYAFLDARVYDALAMDDFDKAVELSIRCKEHIVEKDFKEGGERAKLNLGHTFGHAVERLTKLPHGIAVAIGLEMVIDLFAPKLNDEFNQVRKKLNIDYQIPEGLDSKKFWDLLTMDKKRKDDGVVFIIPTKVGEVKFKKYTVDELKKALGANEKYKSFFS